ncbi:putative short-chain dehydrogenase [Ophiobolus disseminans]|uniref:Putative short-chain dehydrogenase n=1 Tax=Ophiobolus disseminans TaxID=1469910 RepID=A0A6A6ZDP5_9PLEO|nr:putative short-chain dehydrogenase [Ophiobolus disseminans]
MSNQLVALILGAGPNVGQHLSRALAIKGYKVALASRSGRQDDSAPGQTSFQVDLSDPSTVAELFAKVKETLGIPSVVVYNAAAGTLNQPKNSFSVSLADFTKDLNINTTSVFAAAQQAVVGFEQLPDSASRTFIYTGNIMNTGTVIAPLMTAGVGKSASAHLLQNAAAAYADRGFKFYYADERNEDGSPVYSKISGEGHAQHYVELTESKEQGPWQQTFVSGQGYKRF